MASIPTSHASTPTREAGPQSAGVLTDRIIGVPLERGFRMGWLLAFGASLSVLMLGLVSIAWLLFRGVGVWGINVPVAWGFAIINFVWWIGIGHAGTLISAILLLMRQTWRNSINRFAEAMTLFAVANAGLFPLLHLGRIWKFYYILPYPNVMGTWPQWRSPLVWDVFAVLTYSLVSLLFWYIGLIPDFASLRDRANRRWIKIVAGFFSWGWRGSAKHWHNYQTLYLLLAGLATPLVVSVHSIVSLDFAVSIVPGWHSTIFPPFFVAGAIYSGFAMVLVIAIPLRRFFHFEDFVTLRHLDNMGKVMLVSGLIVAYGYVMETFTGWFTGEPPEHNLILNRAEGPYAFLYWAMIGFNVLIGQSLWFRWIRTKPLALFLVAIFINIGMWLERFVIIVVSLNRDYMPSAWGMYYPTFWDWSLLAGTVGFFATLMLLFIRLVPMISVHEMRELLDDGPSIEGDDCPTPATDPVNGPAEVQPARTPPLEGVMPRESLYGMIAEFERPEEVTRAATVMRGRGYSKLDALTPYPVHGLPASLGLGRSRIWRFVLAGAVLGGASAYFMQWYSVVLSYPINVGGRPLHSWPSFIPLTFELSVLGGAVFGVLGLMVLNRLPQPYHPVFNGTNVDRASRDRFFLCIEAEDPCFDRTGTRTAMEDLRPLRVSEVAR